MPFLTKSCMDARLINTAVMYDAILHKPLHFREEIHVSQADRGIHSAVIDSNVNILNLI